MTKEKINTILAADCGSTTTKTILIERQGDGYRLIARGEAPTTVEAPLEDVTIGMVNALRELQEITARKFLKDGKPNMNSNGQGDGADLFVMTSSAGGGLQMVVGGVIGSMTGRSAQRAALGAGAIVMDVITYDDPRSEEQKIDRLRQLRPDMVLLSGGTDGGTKWHVVHLAEMLLSANPVPRFATNQKLPVILAGNREAVDGVRDVLNERMTMHIVDNIRPELERENLTPARNAVHEIFLHHVMSQAPGYNTLLKWASTPIMPTPHAVGRCIEVYAEKKGINVLAVDIGGATTDVFTVFDGQFHRSVSANFGMSYSIGNVLKETGLANILRWLPIEMPDIDVRNMIRNKMVRPTTVPQTLQELWAEQAVCREALRLSFEHHRTLAAGLAGVRQQRTVSEALDQSTSGASLVNVSRLDLIVGSGGALSHAPRRAQAALMMLDAFGPIGISRLAVDSIFMMPQLGVLGETMPEVAIEVFEKDCMVPLGVSVCPTGKYRPGKVAITGRLGKQEFEFRWGELAVLPLGETEQCELVVDPHRGADVGEGRGRTASREITGGKVGVIFDLRGRPIQLPQDKQRRLAMWRKWCDALSIEVSDTKGSGDE